MKILSMRISSLLAENEQQTVELKSDGTVKVTYKNNKADNEKKKVEPVLASSLLQQVYGLKERFVPMQGRVRLGVFHIVFKTDEGEEKYMGMEDMYFVEGEEISQVLRDSLGMDSLFLLDGNRLWVMRYCLEYHRETDMSYADGNEEHVSLSELFIIDVVERVVIVSTLLDNMVAARHEVHMTEDVFNMFMEEFQDLDLEGTSDERELPKTNDMKVFESRVFYSNGEEVVTQASFDADHLPQDYEILSRLLMRVLESTRVGGDTVYSDLWRRNAKKKGQILLCTVEFENDQYREFFSKDDSLQAGDRVVVPFGKNKTREGHVVETQFVDRSYGSRRYIIARSVPEEQ